MSTNSSPKKGPGFRLWFRKLSIKRFHTVTAQRQRRPSSSHRLRGLCASSSQATGIHGGVLSSPYHTLNSTSNHSSPCGSPPVETFLSSSSASPQNVQFSAISVSSPWSQRFPAPISHHNSLCTSPTQDRRYLKNGAMRRSSSSSTITPAVLLSPINRKRIELPYPSAGSSPCSFMQNRIFHAAPAVASPEKIYSPPPRSAQLHTILFRSPLHPLIAERIVSISRSESNTVGAESHSLFAADSSTVSANFFANSSSKPKVWHHGSRACDAAVASVSQAQNYGEAASSETATNGRDRPATIRTSSTKQSPVIVDCGCRPNLSSSFRKTKKALQACGSCQIKQSKVLAVHDRSYGDAMQKLSVMKSAKESQNSACKLSFIGRQDEPSHGTEEIPHKVFQHLRRRQKKSLQLANPNALPTNVSSHCQHFDVRTGNEQNVKREVFSDDRQIKSRGVQNDGALLIGDARALGWDKDFSSFTSEDTFFSSFERGRPSFSSNSSSELLEKKLRKNSLVLNTTSIPSGGLDSRAQIHSDSDTNVHKPCNVACHAKYKLGDPQIEVRFYGQTEENKEDLSAFQHCSSCGVVSCQHRMSNVNSENAAKRSCLRPLVGIKEGSCEEGITNTTEQDYYASAHVRPVRNARARKKSSIENLVDDTGTACSRRQSQLRAEWMLENETIQWHSSVDESGVDGGSESSINAEAATLALAQSDVQPRKYTGRTGGLQSKLDLTKIAADMAESKLSGSKELVSGAAPRTCPASFFDTQCASSRHSETSIMEHPNETAQTSFAIESRLIDSVAVVKSSRDPLVDFRESMVDMIMERQIYTEEELGELLQCFLLLNPSEHHRTIMTAFLQVCTRISEGN